MKNFWNIFKRSVACWELNVPFTPENILDVVSRSSVYLINIGEKHQILELLNKQYRDLHDIKNTQELYKNFVALLNRDEHVLYPLYREGFEYFKNDSTFEGYDKMESLSTKLYFYDNENKLCSDYVYDLSNLEAKLNKATSSYPYTVPPIRMSIDILTAQYYLNEINKSGFIRIYFSLYTDIWFPQMLNLNNNKGFTDWVSSSELFQFNGLRLNAYLRDIKDNFKILDAELKKSEPEYFGYDQFVSDNGIIEIN